ncbi:hypothetical protein H9Y04_25995 [Streptomyces sp. TRM66268-LWL]|uniref:Integral membrane protein n=1 Tax=Streptomyces polyasparticus TaxID=2767826 RepID=A0ABR7SKQ2_9ACTN|nr:DUF6332 family protein [Streptomyces polyasparticus]MBC9715998.1 hypothetical protein [Streptomyces polyasparticus]
MTCMGTRTQAQRDAATVEIGYALVSAVFLAALVFAVVAGPAWAFGLPRGPRDVLVGAGAVLAPIAFLVRVVSVLWRFRNAGRQPSQPGRTSPDS